MDLQRGLLVSDFGFVGSAYTALSETQDDQELINWFCEVDPTKRPGNVNQSADRGIIALYPTPGLITLAQPVEYEVRGLRTLTGGTMLLGVWGNTLYTLDTSYNTNAVGTLLSSSGPIKITDNGTSAYITDGDNRYTYTWASNSFSIVTDGAFNGGDVCDIIDNFIIYNRPGTNEWGCTDASSIASSGLNLGEKLIAQDNIVSLVAARSQVYLLGEITSEVQTDVGAFPFPFQVLSGASMQHGCAATFSVARLGESIAFIAQDNRGQAVIVQMNGYNPQRISTHAVEVDISSGVISDAIGFTYQQNGHEFYVLTFPTQDKTWCYDLSASSATGIPMWHKRAWRRDYDNSLHRIRANCCASFNGQIVVGDWQNGKLYEYSTSTYDDAGDTILRRRRPPHITSDLNNAYHHSLQIQFQPGVGLPTGQGSNPKAILRWSNDGGFTWSNDHDLFIGKQGQYLNRAIRRSLGCARDRVYEVDVTDPINAVVVSADLRISAGQS